MSKKLINKSPVLIALLSLLFGGLFFVSSCKPKQNEEPADFVMYCRQIKQTEIKTKWVDQGWTKNGNTNKIVQLWFSVNKIGRQLQIDIDPMKSWDQFIPGGGFTLSKETSCKQELPENAEYVDNWIKLDSLKIVADATTGALIDFDFIRLTPIQDENPYVNYKLDVIKVEAGVEKILVSAKSYPCPPHCPKEETVD